MTEAPIQLLLDEHVSRVFQRVLDDRGYDVVHAKDQFGERTVDEELLAWAAQNDVVLCTNDTRDFRELAAETDHAGLLLYRDQSRPDVDPVGLAEVVDAVVDQYGTEELADEIVELGEWYDWMHD